MKAQHNSIYLQRRTVHPCAGRRPEDAVALIIVLAMLVLLSGLIVSFMSTVGNERAASVVNSSTGATRQIADSTINLVMANIREATSQASNNTTWASQPGAIRTFSGQIGPKVNTVRGGGYLYGYTPGGNDWVYKLYSADKMKVKSDQYANDIAPGSSNNEVGVIENWDRTKPKAGFVDLNEPILSNVSTDSPTTVEPRYPIIDPRARFDKAETPSNTAFGLVEGLDCKSAGLLDSQLKTPVGKFVPYLPMPVKWLYVLRDGSMASADTTTGKVEGAGAENPIVGRTAFWTDDESCKLNINTASEGVFWDTPSVSSEPESGKINSDKTVFQSSGFSLASSQPAQGEYQRYPGHPATTCLSPALGWLWDLTPAAITRPTQNPQYQKFKEAIYSMAPFIPVGKGTSAGAGVGLAAVGTNFPGGVAYPGGTDNPDRVTTTDPKTGATIPAKPAIATKALYATVDEYLFKRDPKTVAAQTRLLNAFTNASATNLGTYGSSDFQKKLPAALEKLRFVLTTNSRAPELNLFGRPRVTIWPVHGNILYRTPADDLFAFTSTVGGIITSPKSKGYYFQRIDAKSDRNDYQNFPRNQSLMTYLKGVTGDNVASIPGFGGSFANKYRFARAGATERDQILTEIFDYIRAVNLVDTGFSRAGSGTYKPYTPFFGTGITGYGGISARSYDWSGQVTPIVIGGTKGLGRFMTVSEVALMFQRVSTANMQAVLFFEISTAMPGFPALRETYWTKATQVDKDGNATNAGTVTIGTGAPKALNICSKPMININNISSHEMLDGRGFMPTLGCGTAFFYFAEHTRVTNTDLYPTDPARNTTANFFLKNFVNTDANSVTYRRNATIKTYPYVSDPIAAGNRVDFLMNDLRFKIDIYTGEAPDDTKSVLTQTIYVTFPSTTLKAPDGTVSPLSGRFAATLGGAKDSDQNFIQTYDTSRGMEFVGGSGNGAAGAPFADGKRGDLRLLTAQTTVSDYQFQPRGGKGGAYFTSANFHVTGLQYGHGEPMGNGAYFGTSGLLAAGGTNRSKVAILPANLSTPAGNTMNGVQRSDLGPGDYDRGLSKHMDGAFGNKVDEGNVQFDYTASVDRALPYYTGRNIEETGQSFFSPNRMLSSAVMFGGLPSGALEGKPWQTLLFRPDREKGASPGHPGAANLPPDHLLLDLFHLPIVEPYAISEPFSTAGKVNLNFVIAPFGYAKGDTGNNFGGANNPRSYLRRDTALRGVFKSTKIMAVSTTFPEAAHTENETGVGTAVRFDIDPNLTLEQFEARFKDQKLGLFRSTSEICDMDLYPSGLTIGSGWKDFWNGTGQFNYAQTGDNMRERPYAHIYPRVTTKSNVFTVHMRCQSIKKAPGTAPDQFVDNRDQVLGEYRGSATIERFIDPTDKKLEDYDELNASLDPYYRFRVISTKQFTPK